MGKHFYTNENQIKSFNKLKGIFLIIVILGLLFPLGVFAQKVETALPDSAKVQQPINLQLAEKTTYPKVVGYLSFIFPLVTVSKTTTHNFNGITTIGFPIGVNVLYSDKFGFSYEFTPLISAGKGTSKMGNLLFDPGTMFRFKHGFTIISRLAFETSGRYGFTPVFNKVYLRTKDVNYFVALSTPARFGNNVPASVGLNLQLGFIFN